jgi:hypothetical protein
VPDADRTHLDDLSFDEFDPIVLGENSERPVILIHGKKLLRNLCSHKRLVPARRSRPPISNSEAEGIAAKVLINVTKTPKLQMKLT